MFISTNKDDLFLCIKINASILLCYEISNKFPISNTLITIHNELYFIDIDSPKIINSEDIKDIYYTLNNKDSYTIITDKVIWSNLGSIIFSIAKQNIQEAFNILKGINTLTIDNASDIL